MPRHATAPAPRASAAGRSWPTSGMGFIGLALGAMLHRDGVVRADAIRGWAPPDGRPHFTPRAKQGHLADHARRRQPPGELRPQARADQARRQDDRRDARTRTSSTRRYLKNVREQVANNIIDKTKAKIYPLQVGFRKGGQSGIEVSDWWPHVARLRRRPRRRPLDVDDRQQPRRPDGVPHRPAPARRLLPDDRRVGPLRPRGAERRPAAVHLDGPAARIRSASGAIDADYLGPEHAGVLAQGRPGQPAPLRPARGATSARARRRSRPSCSAGSTGSRPSSTPTTRSSAPGSSRTSWPSGCRRPSPRCSSFDDESEATRRLYGLDHDVTRPFGQQLLAARRLVERGVRFVQVFHGDGAAGAWDAHSGLKANHAELCAPGRQADRRPATDLKRRGLLDETIVVWATEFGRTPVRAGRRRPRPPQLRLLGLDGRRRDQGRASSTARPTSSASTPSSTATTSPTSTPRSSTCWASTPAGWRSPAASGWRSSTAGRSGRSSPEG